MSKFDITVEQLTELNISVCDYYQVDALSLPTSVNFTVWTIIVHTIGFTKVGRDTSFLPTHIALKN